MKIIIIGLLFSFSIHAKENFNIAAFGDSISRGFNADRLFLNLNLSWVTGDGPTKEQMLSIDNFSSHYMKIKKMFPNKTINSFNYAVSGSTSSSLKRQAKRFKRKGQKIDYATVLSGANDLCRMRHGFDKKMLKIKSNVQHMVEKLIEHNKDIKIYLAPIPNMDSLYEAMKDVPKCQLKWNLYPLCRVFLASNVTEKERGEFLDRVERVNKYFGEIADQYKDNVKYNLALGDIEFGEESISKTDCFHPAAEGQALLSEYTWDPEFILGRELRADEDYY